MKHAVLVVFDRRQNRVYTFLNEQLLIGFYFVITRLLYCSYECRFEFNELSPTGRIERLKTIGSSFAGVPCMVRATVKRLRFFFFFLDAITDW